MSESSARAHSVLFSSPSYYYNVRNLEELNTQTYILLMTNNMSENTSRFYYVFYVCIITSSSSSSGLSISATKIFRNLIGQR